ncbi:MAG: tatC [Phycisphaerales bacterium]|nr:tatC [Phycisphaerales bacterium]
MAVATPKKAVGTNGSKPDPFDPDDYRMTLGDHLEELRGRLVLALGGYAILLVAAFFFGDKVVAYFCLPLIRALRDNNINTQLVMTEVGEGFSVFIEITMVSAAAVGAPWIAYQIWQFVAAGLYPHERKYVTRYLPLSIGLLISGMLFVYFLVLPWTLVFLIGFGTDIKLPGGALDDMAAPTAVVKTDAPKVGVYAGNPPTAAPGDIWYDSKTKRMKTFVEGRVRTIQLTSDNLLTPQIKLSTYIEVVETSLLIFGLSFQLPLVVLAVARIGVVPLDKLKAIRSYVYFALAVASAVITPGGDIPSMLGLTVPLIGLYELGIWLARLQPKSEEGEGGEAAA